MRKNYITVFLIGVFLVLITPTAQAETPLTWQMAKHRYDNLSTYERPRGIPCRGTDSYAQWVILVSQAGNEYFSANYGELRASTIFQRLHTGLSIDVSWGSLYLFWTELVDTACDSPPRIKALYQLLFRKPLTKQPGHHSNRNEFCAINLCLHGLNFKTTIADYIIQGRYSEFVTDQDFFADGTQELLQAVFTLNRPAALKAIDNEITRWADFPKEAPDPMYLYFSWREVNERTNGGKLK